MRTVLVTGVSGFIGYHLAAHLLRIGDAVVGIDNLNSYYDPTLKMARLRRLRRAARFSFVKGDICDAGVLQRLVDRHAPEAVVHLAAQAGVRYSLDHPEAYGSTNLIGTLNVLEACRRTQIGHLVLASSSSVYGANSALPWAPGHPADHPLSLYAATKRAAELMAYSYAHLFRLPVTALRFFTVYGPYGRPDMAIFSFARAMLAGEPLQLYNSGRMSRDFTYVADAVRCIVGVLGKPACVDVPWSTNTPHAATRAAPFAIYNVGSSHPVELREVVAVLERHLGRSADVHDWPIQPGDVTDTWADVSSLKALIGYAPDTSLDEGVGRFVEWYRAYYGVLTESASGVWLGRAISATDGTLNDETSGLA